jgi:hypothetical protein
MVVGAMTGMIETRMASQGLGNESLVPILCSLRSTLLGVPEPLCPSFVAHVAAANINSHTRLSHVTEILGHDWCTHE